MREAKRCRDEFMKTVNRADYIVPAQIPFREFVETYKRQHIPTLAVSTREKYLNHLRNHIEPEFAKSRLMDITTERIQMWLLGKRLNHSTRIDLKNILSGIFTAAAKWGYWKDKNPVEFVTLGRGRKVYVRRKWTDAELGRFVAALQPDVALIVRAALLTLRSSEIFAVQEKHLDFGTGVIRVEQSWYRGKLEDYTKSARATREIPMGDLAPDLQARCVGDPEQFVFSVRTPRGESREERDINQHFLRPVAKRLGLYYRGFGIRHFRHEAVTELGKLDPMQAQKVAGHSKVNMTAHYTLGDRQRQETAIRRFQRRISGGKVVEMPGRKTGS
jgi:integrase